MTTKLAEWVTALDHRIDAAKSRFDEYRNKVTDDDKSKLAGFERRYEELRQLAIEGDGEIELNGPDAPHKSLQQELDNWVADLDLRFNGPAHRIRNVSM